MFKNRKIDRDLVNIALISFFVGFASHHLLEKVLQEIFK